MNTKLQPIREQIDIWSLDLNELQAEADTCRALLTDAELERAAKFHRPEDRSRFVLSRGLLRRILAGYLDTPPAQLAFKRNENGKPFLEKNELEFNVSHSHDRLLIAVTAGRPVGVDIERRREGLRMAAITSRWFSPQERSFFQGLDNPPVGFFDIWAKKEAYVKAIGTGIFKKLSSFSVPTGGHPGTAEVGSDPEWFFQTLEIDPAYAAAIVSATPPVPIRIRKLTQDI